MGAAHRAHSIGAAVLLAKGVGRGFAVQMFRHFFRMPHVHSVEGPWGLGYTPHHERLSCASVPDQQTQISRFPVETMAGGSQQSIRNPHFLRCVCDVGGPVVFMPSCFARG